MASSQRGRAIRATSALFRQAGLLPRSSPSSALHPPPSPSAPAPPNLQLLRAMSAGLPLHQTPSATASVPALPSTRVGLRALLPHGPESLPSGASARAGYATVAVSRDPQFATLEDADVEYFKGILGERGVITDPDAVAAANVDWMGKYKGNSKLLLRPTTTSHVADVLKYCNERRLAVVPQGGNTGLVGGSVPVFDEVSADDTGVAVPTEPLPITTITDISPCFISLLPSQPLLPLPLPSPTFGPLCVHAMWAGGHQVSGILDCEAGCILESLDTFLADKGFVMPLDLGAKGSCQIGGNVSTNAGGIRLLRYGSLHGSVLGLEVVMADGTVVDMTRALRKDNTGYDLKQLFIGTAGDGIITVVAAHNTFSTPPLCFSPRPFQPSRPPGAEGTLGVVTRVVLLAPPRSPSVHVALLGCSSFDAVQQVFCASRRHLGEVLSAAEFFDRSSLQMVLKHNEGTRDPLPDGEYPFYVLIETSGSNPDHDRTKLDAFLEGVMEAGAVEDGTVAHDSTQAAAIWHLREGVAEALQRAGAVYKYDLSVPVSQLYGLVDEMRSRLEGSAAQVVGYGHLGDGNLHLNISAPTYDDKLLERIEPFVYEWVAGRQGSVSAEHGLGLMKANAIHYSKDPQAVRCCLSAQLSLALPLECSHSSLFSTPPCLGYTSEPLALTHRVCRVHGMQVAVMKRVKALFDPNGILNPYKLLPSS
ncbi:unnamed protein product [Closterium sp. NIES-65]|nr:unnamed protein product [Closterium sp. NIES-65]